MWEWTQSPEELERLYRERFGELRDEDGTRTALKPVNGFLLYVIPPAHYALGHRLESLAWLDAAGRETATRSFDTKRPGIYPCKEADEKKLDYGVRICP